MTKNKHYFLALLLLLSVSSCQFINNSLTFKNTTEEFIAFLLAEDYDGCMSLFSLEHESFRTTIPDSLKAQLPNFRTSLIERFGSELDFSLAGVEKTFSTQKENTTLPQTTLVNVEFYNQEVFGIFDLIFDDSNKKIINIHFREVREPIPNMLLFWIFGLLALCVLAFNIYIIRKIARSSLKRKGWKYFGVLFFNVPAINYTALGSLGFSLLSFQMLFGISFNFMGFSNSVWTFGIPLGGLYWFWQLYGAEKSELPKDQDDLLDHPSEIAED